MGYVHGYSADEARRLADQARTLAGLLHHDTIFPGGGEVLEAGCGTGSQTVAIARLNPDARITACDISEESLARARLRASEAGVTNVVFRQADIEALPFEEETFDHVFVCFVLEHLADAPGALRHLRRVLRRGGSMTVIEGDHGSAFFHPDSVEAGMAIDSLVRLQAISGGNALIGRELYPLLEGAGFSSVRVSPRVVHAHAGLPEMVEGFTEKTFIAMIEGARQGAVCSGLIDEGTFDRGIAALHRTARPDGTFCYTFFKATGARAP
jgi:ubiquinone/menaquinone biosynthesis C-methylase UbiE